MNRIERSESAGRAGRRRLIILGSTGSIGVSTLDVVSHLRRSGSMDFEVVGLAAGTNLDLLLEQAQQEQVPHLAIADGDQAVSARARAGAVRRVFTGPTAATELIEAVAQAGDLVVGAMVGAAGIPATLAAIERGCDMALANKETLVAAGALVMPLAHRRGVQMLPVDSEHCAIFQCLATIRAFQGPGAHLADKAGEGATDGRSPGPVDVSTVRRIVITASGGPFRSASRQDMERATVEQALNHPTWTMGRKITIDSATLMNKALEIIEAHWLFGLEPSKIDVVIHPQSIVHGFVEFVDGSVIAQLGPPDMRTPIQLALTWPGRVDGCARHMDWSMLKRMEFEPVDHHRFPAVRLATEVIERGGTAGAVLNAANETAVHAFLDGRIGFGRITPLVRAAMDAIAVQPVRALQDVLDADHAARSWVTARIHEDAAVHEPMSR